MLNINGEPTRDVTLIPTIAQSCHGIPIFKEFAKIDEPIAPGTIAPALIRANAIAKNADNIIIGSPTYWGNIPGSLKVLFDRNVYLFMGESKSGIPVPKMKGKKAITGSETFMYDMPKKPKMTHLWKSRPKKC